MRRVHQTLTILLFSFLAIGLNAQIERAEFSGTGKWTHIPRKQRKQQEEL